jgi:hypothetical protein
MLGRVPTACLAIAGVITTVLLWRMISSRLPPGERHLDRQARVSLLDKSLRAVEDGDRETPRDSWDPEYIVKTVGRDPQRLFAWVRDNTYWIPYRGALRGPAGVLMDRQGNSLDRAILLATLLEKAGHTVRLGHGELSRQQALDLLPTLVADRAIAFAPRQETNTENLGIQRAAMQYQLDGAAIGGSLKIGSQMLSSIASELRARVIDQTRRLLQAIERPDDAEVRGRTLDAALVALTDHWWVQREDGQNWVDLDLLSDPAKPSAAVATANQVVALKDLPAELRHEIALRVIAEQWVGGRLREYKALEHTLRPADLMGQSVALQFWPSAWIGDSKPHASRQDWKTQILAQKEWDAVLAVGGKVLAATVLQEDGDDPNAPVKGGEFAGFASAFSDSMNLSPRADPKTLSAVWLEYEIRVPGEKPRAIRRSVFDLLGAAARAAPKPPLVLDQSKMLTRGLALTMQTEILPIACGLAPEFTTHLLAQNLLRNRDLFHSLLAERLPPDVPDVQHLFDHSVPPLSPLYALALARMEWGQRQQVFIDRPNILTRHIYAVPSGKDAVLRDATDIVSNEVGVSLVAHDEFATRLAQGVLDTNAESLLRRPAVADGNAGDAFATPNRWTAVALDQDAAGLARLRLPDDVRQQIAGHLAAGYAVVAPESAVATQREPFAGWWRIDRSTGDALGLGANGWGAAMMERSPWYARLAQIANRWNLAGRAVTFVVTASSDYGWCITPLVTKYAEDVENRAPKLGATLAIWEGAVKPSWHDCGGNAVVVGGITAWLLPARVLKLGAGVSAARRLGGPKEPPAPRTAANTSAPKEPCPEGHISPGAQSVSPEAQSVSPQRMRPPPEPVRPTTAQDVVDALGRMKNAQKAEYQATRDAVRYQARGANTPDKSFYDPGEPGPADYDPGVAKQLFRDAELADQAAMRAEREFTDTYNDFRFWNPNSNPFKQAGPGPGGVCGGNDAASGPSSSLDPALRDARPGVDPYGRTQPGADPLGKTQPGADPLGKTQPGADPLGKTQPGADPLGQTQPGADPLGNTEVGSPPTQRSPNLPESTPGPTEEPMPPTEPGAPPTRRGPPSSDPSAPPTQRSPQYDPVPPTPAQKTLTGIGGVLGALGPK